MDNTCKPRSWRSKTVSSAASYLRVWKVYSAKRGHCPHRQMDALHTHTYAPTRAYNGLHLQHATKEDHLNTHTPAWVNCHHVLFLNNCKLRGREKKGRFKCIKIVWWRKMNTKRRREDVRWFAKLPLASCGPLRHTGLVLARQIAFAGSMQWKQHDAGPGSGGITILSSHLVLCSL